MFQSWIESLEDEIAQMDKLLDKPGNLADEDFYKRYDTLKTELAKTMELWENAHHDLELWKEKKTW
jgi:hypothetical protein